MGSASDEKSGCDLKVLFVTESFPPVSYGGGEISCALLAEGLAEKGVDVTVLTSEGEGLKETEIKNGVKIVRRLKTGERRDRLKENLKRRTLLKRSVKEEVPNISSDHDLIHFFNITSIADVRTEKPTFATINSYINFCPKGNLFYREESVCEGCRFTKFLGCITHSEYVGNLKMSKMLRYNPVFWIGLYLDYKKRNRCLNYVDHFFSLSGFISERLSEAGIERKNIVKVPNVPKIETSEKELDLPDGRPLLAYIGALTKIKGVDLLISAFDKLDSEAKLVIVGDGPERKNLEKMAGENENIVFLGEVEHDSIPSVYRRSDVIVVPSVWPEPLSRVLLEAAYFGKPIIATDVGGSPDVVKHGYNGFLVKPDTEDLKKKLEQLIKDEDKIKDMEDNMIRYYKKELSKDKVVEKIMKVYTEKLRSRGVGSSEKNLKKIS
ncbi:MAG: glycosyltransferase family 4 protein [Candidatus Natronoplasma sp.]